MKPLLDTHSHTIASGHAYSTINEMVLAAREKGLKLLCITDHTPSMPGSCDGIYFRNFKVIDRVLHGVEVFMGAELNIINYDGEIDLPIGTLKKLDMAIASFHTICLEPGTIEQNTNAYLKVMDNPFINILGHPEDGRIPFDIDAVVKKAKETDTLIELNNSSLNPGTSRVNSYENAIKLLEACKKYNAYVTLGSDAHFFTQVGNHETAIKLLNEVNFPHELIISLDVQKFKDFIGNKRAKALATV